MAPTYRIKDWGEHFEKSHKESERAFRWVALPTKHDGKSFRRLGRRKDGAELFCAFVLMVEVAAKMPIRGTLHDSDGPLDAESLADKTGFPERIFKNAFKLLKEPQIGWIEVVGESRQVATSRDSVRPNGNRCPTSRATEQDNTGQDRTEQNKTEHPLTPAERGDADSGETLPSGSRAPLHAAETDSAFPGFDKFWAVYPAHDRKKAQAKCRGLWRRRGLEKHSRKVIEGLLRWNGSAAWAKDGGQFIPAPHRWLNEDWWENSPAPAVDQGGDVGTDPSLVTAEILAAFQDPKNGEHD